MKTDIEKLLKDNKEHLNVETPPSDVWQNIQGEIKEVSSKTFQVWKVAAAILLVTSLGLLVYNFSLQKQVEELASLGDISEEYRKVENAYQSEINQLTGQIPIKEVLTSEELSWMLEELEALEEINKQYRADIGTEADKELLVNALVDYYEKKIRLLKKLELEINRQKNEERTTNNISTI